MTNIAIIILLNFVVFFRTLSYGMVIDDNCRKWHVNDISKNLIIRFWNKTRYSGYGGLSLPVDHLFTLLFHTTCCVAIYLCLGSSLLSFITALLFSVHPVNTQGSVWMNGKRHVIVATFVLLMWGLKPYGAIFYLLTPLWHFTGLPAILLYTLTPYSWIMWLIPVMLIIFHRKIIDKIGTRWERIPAGEIKRLRPRKFVILIKMIGYLFYHSIFPRKLSFYHIFMERFGFSDKDNAYWYSFNKDFWLGIPVIIGIPILIALNWNNPIGFGLFWWLIFTVPWCQFPIGLTQAVAERTCYLPNVGLMYALSYIVLKLSLPYHLLTALFVYYLTRTLLFMPSYKDIDEFYRHVFMAFPGHFRARAHVAQRYLRENKLFWALKECGIGLKYNPKDCTLNLLMCQCLMALGAWKDALKYLKEAGNNMVLGQEIYMKRVIDNFHRIITTAMTDPDKLPKQIKSDEVVEIKPSQIVKGK